MILCFIPLIPCYQFFALQIVQNVSMAIGPIAQYHENSKYYSARKPRPNKAVDNFLPHITIQMPVYKESLETVLYVFANRLREPELGLTLRIAFLTAGRHLLRVSRRQCRLTPDRAELRQFSLTTTVSE